MRACFVSRSFATLTADVVFAALIRLSRDPRSWQTAHSIDLTGPHFR